MYMFYYSPRNKLREYNVFHPTIRQSVSPSVLFFLFSATPLKPLNRISINFVVMKDIMCRCTYPQEILIQFFFSELRPFLTQKFGQKRKGTVCQRKSSETVQQNNLKICSCEGQAMQMCISIGNFDLFSFSELRPI